VEACAIVLAAGRPLPDLAGILASHALIHTAEGEFFRQVIRKACETLAIAVTGIRERDLDARAASLFGKNKSRVDRKIAEQGRILGPPWTQDQKLATLAATLVLADLCGHPYSKGPAS